MIRGAVLAFAVVSLASPLVRADENVAGVLAWSAGDAVGLADPSGRWTREFETGPVGWLYPGPGGVLFAPDLVHGRTSVLDVRNVAVRDRYEGVTVPWFGDVDHRYYVCLPGELRVVSYPDRALIATVDVDVRSPWRFEVATDDSSALILDRTPDGSGGAALVAVDLVARRQVYRRALPTDVQQMDLSQTLGLLAVADGDPSSVKLLEPASLATVLALPVPGPVRDVGFAGDGTTLVAAVGDATSAAVCAWQLKGGDDGLRVRRERCAPLPGVPMRLAVAPDGDRLAVATDVGSTPVMDVRRLEVEATIETPADVRDLVWYDPSRPGPPVPEWSDEGPASLTIGRLPGPSDR